jgi:dTDP-L-rhamnose 4-epimerase
MEVADVLIKIFKKGRKPEITQKYRRGDIRHCFADISKIMKLGYSPSIDFSKGMEELVRWSTRQHSEDKFDEAYEEVRKRGLVG